MAKTTIQKGTDVALAVLKATPTGALISEIMKAVADDQAPAGVDLPALSLEAERQELEMRKLEAKARVAQEIAIATRIEQAEEVVIEEFYDTSGSGHLGLSATGEKLSIGAGGSGRRVSRRVYRFVGGQVGREVIDGGPLESA